MIGHAVNQSPLFVWSYGSLKLTISGIGMIDGKQSSEFSLHLWLVSASSFCLYSCLTLFLYMLREKEKGTCIF
jgi:hypothetical protein